jgi:glycosyltransferase involved in cell wall biosynthesis
MVLSPEVQTHHQFLSTQTDNFALEYQAKQKDKITHVSFVQDPDTRQLTLDLPIIKREDLPNVSIVTLTKNRKLIFNTAVFCYLNFMYPREKLEWIIVDDSDKMDEDITDLLPDNTMNNIRHIKLHKTMSVSDKRNLGCSLAKNELIMNMDDDDYYYPDTILAKVRALHKYPSKDLVVSCLLAIYNILNNTSQLVEAKLPSVEASMMFRKSYWKSRMFCPHPFGEGFSMVYNAFDKVLDLPYMFNFISVTHYANVTGSNRRYKPIDDDKIDFLKLMSANARGFFVELRKEILTKLGAHSNVVTEK